VGGSKNDIGNGIAVGSDGSAYVTGYTESENFPTKDALYGTLSGPSDAFVTKLNPQGSALVYSTFLGGSDFDSGNGLALSSDGSAYIAGGTESPNFPTVTARYQNYGGEGDGFVAKLNPLGSALVYSMYLGGSSIDTARDIAVDGDGSAYITGETYSSNFPTAVALYGSLAGLPDAFVTKISDFSCFIENFKINNGALYAKSATVTLAYDLIGNPSQYRISVQGKWSTWTPIPIPHTVYLKSPDGSRTVYLQVRDAAGNTSPIAGDTIILDTKPPKGSVLINNNAASVTRTGNTTSVTLSIVATDATSGLDKMALYQTGDTLPKNPPENAFIPFVQTLKYSLKTVTAGKKSVYIWFKDKAGNIGVGKSDSIKVNP
jgi:hypothetical protein